MRYSASASLSFPAAYSCAARSGSATRACSSPLPGASGRGAEAAGAATRLRVESDALVWAPVFRRFRGDLLLLERPPT